MNPSESLLQSAQANDLHKLRSIITENPSLNLDIRSTDRFERTPLEWAIYHKNLDLVKVLVEKGANINLYNKKGFGPLYEALGGYQRPILFYLIEQGAAINHIPEYAEKGETLLHEVTFRGDVALLEVLYAKGINLNKEYNLWGSSIDAAIEGNHLEIAQSLVERGADMEVLFYEGCNALMVAIEEGKTEGAILLLALGANPNAVSEFGWSPLCFAAKAGNIKIAEALLQKGANINFTIPKERNGQVVNEDEYGLTPIFLAISNNRLPMLRFLIAAGANMEVLDLGKSIVLSTIENKELAATKILIDAGADIFATTSRQETALFLVCLVIKDCTKTLKAAQSPDAGERDKVRVKKLIANQTLTLAVELLQILLEKGANAHTIAAYAYRNQVTALQLLLESENLLSIELLLKYGAKSIYYDQVRGRIDLTVQLNSQNPAILALLNKQEALAFDHLQLPVDIQPILKQWDILAKHNYFPYANYHDYFRLYRIRLTAYVSGKKWKLIFQQLGCTYNSSRFHNWIGVLTQKSTTHTDWYQRNDLTTQQNFRAYYIDERDTEETYQKSAKQYGEKIPDNASNWARIQQFKVLLNKEEHTLKPSWEDYQAAGVPIKKAYYSQNNTVNEYDLFEVAMHLLADKMWLENPLEALNLISNEENWLPVFEDEGDHILAHIFKQEQPSATVYWQKIARLIVGKKK